MTHQYWQYIISTNQVMVGLVIDAVTTLRSRWDEVFTSNQCWCIFESASLINPATVELRLVTQNLWKCQNIVTQLDFIYPPHVCSVHVTVLCTLNVNMLLLQFDLSLDTSHYLFFVPLVFAAGYILFCFIWRYIIVLLWQKGDKRRHPSLDPFMVSLALKSKPSLRH